MKRARVSKSKRETLRPPDGLSAGIPVQIREYRRSPLAGHTGWIAQVTPGDPYGPYLVQFGGGLRFRYRRDEIFALPPYTESVAHVR